jgi:hypothetical protein
MLALMLHRFYARLNGAARSNRPRPAARARRRARLRVVALEDRVVPSTYYVATTGSDTNNGSLAQPFKTIQHGLDVASSPGDTVFVRGGTYNEKISFPHSGTAAGGSITLEAYSGEQPILDGTGLPSSNGPYGSNNLVQIINRSYVQLIGFEIENLKGTSTVQASGVLVQGFGSHILVQNNIIHAILGSYANGIAVYGGSQTTPLAAVTLDGNQVYNCDPAQSESVTLDGNVTGFQVTNNVVHDCNNIGIDMVGGEAWVFNLTGHPLGLPVARNGLCSHNTVYKTHANYGGGYAGGIYVDGGKNITVSDNVSYQNDLGLEVGAENNGYIASGIVVENNLLYDNRQGGLVFGGYAARVGRVEHCTFINNTVYNSDTSNTGDGQLWIQFASHNLVANNIFVASSNQVLVNSPNFNSNLNNTLDYNLYYATGGAGTALFSWNAKSYSSFAAYLKGTKEDAHSLFGNPAFVNATAADFQLTSTSPAIDAGSSTSGWYALTDFAGNTRDLPPEIGAYEFEPAAQSGLARRSDDHSPARKVHSTTDLDLWFVEVGRRRRAGLWADAPDSAE